MSVFGQSVENSVAWERNRRRGRAGCPRCRALREEEAHPAALACDHAFHRGETGRYWDGQRVVPLPAGLCRCVTCCCKPGEGHNHPAWGLYEAAQRALEPVEPEQFA